MKNLLLITLLLLANLSFGQSFEGTLSYVTDFEIAGKMKAMGITKEDLITRMRQEGSYTDTVKVSYKQGNSYTLMNSNPKSWSIYKSEQNKIYSLQDGEASDICTITDASVDYESTLTGKMPSVTKLDSVAVVNGINCNIVRVKWKTGTYDYYYNPDQLKVDPTLFKKHIYDGIHN